MTSKNRSLDLTFKCLEPRKRVHSPLLAAGLASESENEKLPYGEDSPWLAAGRLQKRIRKPPLLLRLTNVLRQSDISKFNHLSLQVIEKLHFT
jgi:hypothetical protein